MKEIVKLRAKSLKQGGSSLYLDCYLNGQRKFEFLKLYLLPGNAPITKAKNRSTMEAAKVIQAKRIIELQSGKAGILTDAARRMTVNEFADSYISARPVGEDYKSSLRHTVLHWTTFAGDKVKMAEVTPDMLRDYLSYLRTSSNRHHDAGMRRRKLAPEETRERVLLLHGQGISNRGIAREMGIGKDTVAVIIKRAAEGMTTMTEASVRSHYDNLHTIFRAACRRGVISKDPFSELDSIEKPRMKDSIREFLTIEELGLMVKTPCRYPMVGSMFLFACFTGLRYSDVTRITWDDIDRGRITIIQKKTERVVSIPLSENALSVLPERNDKLVFHDYPRLSTINIALRKWAESAGIRKHISFHCSRHTFATLLITHGADLYTVSKLLGHTKVSTTEIYAKVLDSKKTEAVSLIPRLG